MACPACGQATRPGARFCRGVAALSSRSRVPAAARRRLASARFCDRLRATAGRRRRRQRGTAWAGAGAGLPAWTEPVAAVRPRPGGLVRRRPLQVRRFLGEGGRSASTSPTTPPRPRVASPIKTEASTRRVSRGSTREAQAMAASATIPTSSPSTTSARRTAGPTSSASTWPAARSTTSSSRRRDHRLSDRRGVRIAAEICRALEHAHAHGIVHRDLKPGNVWLAERRHREARRLRPRGRASTGRASPSDGMMVGTVAYMAARAGPRRQVDARADLYALGAILYEMLTGRPPFVGDDAVAIISQHLNTPPVAPSWHNPRVPRPLEPWFSGCSRRTPRIGRRAPRRCAGFSRRSPPPLEVGRRRRWPTPSRPPIAGPIAATASSSAGLRSSTCSTRRSRRRSRAGAARHARRASPASARPASPRRPRLRPAARRPGAGRALPREGARRRPTALVEAIRAYASSPPDDAAEMGDGAADVARSSPRSASGCPTSPQPPCRGRAGPLPPVRCDGDVLERRREPSRSCWSSTTSTGPTSRRFSSCSTSARRLPVSRSWSSAPTRRGAPRRHPLSEALADLRRECVLRAGWPSRA